MDDHEIIILYHDDNDGIASMFAAWKRYGDKAKYIKVQYGEDFPIAIDSLNKNTIIYILDFSYDRVTMIEVYNRVKSLVVLEHHKTVKDKLVGLDFVQYNEFMSGATMSWQYFHFNAPIPNVIKHIEDYDLYLFNLDKTREIDLAISTHIRKYDPLFWIELCDDEFLYDKIFIRGSILQENIEINVKNFISNSKKYKVINFENCNAVIYNSTSPINERNMLAEVFVNELDFDIVISYFILPTSQFVFSLRSYKYGNIDVSEIAMKYNKKGGGHKSAAGFTLDFNDAVKLLNTLLS